MSITSKANRAGSIQPADLLLGHHALDILGLALDAVARASIGFDRQACDDGIDAALLDDGASLRPLKLVMNVVIDSEIMGHRLIFPLEEGLLIATARQGNTSHGSSHVPEGGHGAAAPPGEPPAPGAD